MVILAALLVFCICYLSHMSGQGPPDTPAKEATTPVKVEQSVRIGRTSPSS
jgi:hypothetical protein